MTGKKTKKGATKWFEKPATEDDKHFFKRAIIRYAIDCHYSPEDKPAANMGTYRMVIPYLADYLPRWKKVDAENFTAGKQQMFVDYTNTLRNFI